MKQAPSRMVVNKKMKFNKQNVLINENICIFVLKLEFI